jgi:hypothetical protein
MPGCSAKINPGNATSPTRRVPACECRKFVQRSSARSAAAMARPTQTTASARRRRFPRRMTGSASATRPSGKRVESRVPTDLRQAWPPHPARHEGGSRPRDRIDAAGQTLHEPRARVSKARTRAVQHVRLENPSALRFQFRAELQRLRSAASVISGNRSIQSWPLRVNRRTRWPSRWMNRRQPSCLISWIHSGRSGTFVAFVGMQGSNADLRMPDR